MDATPKSSDGETRSGSSSDLQPTDPMETSTGVASSVLGKRKDLGENEDDRESVEEEEEEEEDKKEEDSPSRWDKDTHWDKDSFDGREYNSSDYDRDYLGDDEFEKMCRYYHRTVIETKGFFDGTDGFPPYRWGGFGTVKGLDNELEDGLTNRQYLINLATECVEKYNKTKNKNVRFHEFLRANFHPGSFTKYYITFAARESDSPDAPVVEYQAKIGYRGGKTYPIFCRPSAVKVIEESS